MTAAVRAYSVSLNTWQSRASFPRPVEQTNGAVAINGKIYVSGGFSRRWDAAAGVYRLESLKTLYIYNPALNQWVRKRDMPIYTANGVTGAYQNNLYVAAPCNTLETVCDGAFGGRGVLLRYNPNTDTWKRLSLTPHDPWLAAGGFIGSKFYISNEFASNGTDIYDVATGLWTTGATRPTRLCAGAYTTFKAKLYQVGCSNEDGLIPPMLVYDPAVDAWSERATPPADGAGTLSRVTLANGQVRLELVGGSGSGSNMQYVP
jgi:N-acetylneuraminic acid mutarotase